MYSRILFATIIISIINVTKSSSLISVPSNPTYAVKGGDVFLNWTYANPTSQPLVKRWYQLDKSGAIVSPMIMLQSGANQPTVNKARASYIANAGLHIANVSLSDEGSIGFDVTFDDFQVLQSTISIIVTIPPTIVTGLANQTAVFEGLKSTLQCLFDVRPIPTVKWYLNNVELVGSRFNINTTTISIAGDQYRVLTMLTINNPQPIDTGVISCTAILPNSNISSQTKQIVYYAPRNTSLSSNLANNIVVAGQIVTITCSAVANPPTFYQIFKDGISISNSTSNIYRINSVSLQDEGVYLCVPINYLGEGPRRELNLTVNSAPVLNDYSGNLTKVLQGRPVSIHCIFIGKPAPNITWNRPGGDLPQASYITWNITHTSNGLIVRSVLFFSNTSMPDSGVYQCLAENVAGLMVRNLSLDVQSIPSIQTLPTQINVTINESIVLTCDVESRPASNILWQKDGVTLNNSRIIIENFVLGSNGLTTLIQSNLTINNTMKNDFGTYQCVAVNEAGSSTTFTLINILYKPELLISPPMTSYVQEGSKDFKLECRAESNPIATITWFENGLIINARNDTLIVNSVNSTPANSLVSSSLTFKMTRKSHYGNYSCLATNDLGSAMANNQFIVIYPPFLLQSTAKIIAINASSKHVLFCEFQSNPKSTIQWRIGNKRLASFSYPNTTSITSETSQFSSVKSELTILNSTRFDNGIYSCAAINNLAMVTWNITLVVYYAPLNMTSLLASYSVVEGASLILNCTFMANPQPSVSWRFNQSLIKNSDLVYNTSNLVTMNQLDRTITVSKLIMQSVKKEMQGDYQCLSSNHQGFLSLKTTLIVHYKPIFISAKVHLVTLNSLANLTLSCTVESNPASMVSWLKDGVVISNTTQIHISNKLNFQDQFKKLISSTLQISLVNKTNTGNYSCRAANILGTEYQSTKVIVRYSPELKKNFGRQVNVTESSKSKNFTCTIESYPASTIQWYKNGLPYNGTASTVTLLSTDSKVIKQSSIIFAGGLHRNDFGLYTCNATNILGSASEYTDVRVWYGPEFTSNLTGRVNIRKSSNISFECTVQGHPAPIIEWFKNSKKIDSVNSRITTNTIETTASKTIIQSTIFISKVTKTDTADYKCQASNIVTKRHQSVNLNVQFVPKLLVTSTNITVNRSNPVTLRCLSEANPLTHTHFWSKDGIKMSETGSTYSIVSAEHVSSGSYSCIPANSLGNGTKVTFELLVRIPPSFKSTADCTAQRKINRVVCTCEGAGVPTPIVFWTKNDNKTIIAVGNSFEQRLDQKNIDGKYNCHLKNILGEIISKSNFYYWIKPVSDWEAWGKCNASTCSQGYQTRIRTCQISSCTEHLFELKPCNTTCGSPVSKMKKDEAWLIALYVLIPILIVLLAIFFAWIARTNRKRDSEDPVIIPVNGNLSKPPSVRNVPTRRDIYLPDASFATVNPGYILEEKGNENIDIDVNKHDYETVEAEIGYKDDSSNASERGSDVSSSKHNNNTEEPHEEISTEYVDLKQYDNVDTYLGPEGDKGNYVFYNELSTAL